MMLCLQQRSLQIENSCPCTVSTSYSSFPIPALLRLPQPKPLPWEVVLGLTQAQLHVPLLSPS